MEYNIVFNMMDKLDKTECVTVIISILQAN